MALPSSGAISIKQIAAEFGGTNTLKSNATIASISTSNVGCKSFYGLSSIIDPAYTMPNPPVLTDGWVGIGSGTMSINNGYLYQSDTSSPSGKFATSAIARLQYANLAVTPNQTYKVRGYIRAQANVIVNTTTKYSNKMRVYEQSVWAASGIYGTPMATVDLGSMNYSWKEVNFISTEGAVAITITSQEPALASSRSTNIRAKSVTVTAV